ncbi:MAG: ABC-type transport auxiliary lipoprotein family protein [Gammaproteobacteria bacterium]
MSDRFRLPHVALMLALLALAGCAGPTPPEHFYRLPTPEVAAGGQILDGGMNIALLRTDPVHEDRAMLFSDDPEGLRLEQYRYNHWTANTPDLLRAFMLRYLRQVGVADWVAPADQGRDATYELVGRLLRFERHSHAGRHTVVVRMELELLDRDRRPLGLHREYEQVQELNGDQPLDMARGLRTALAAVMTRFIDDLKRQRTRP